MQIVIPKKNDGSPYTRKEMESFLRENLLSKNHMLLRKFAEKEPYKLHPDFSLGTPINILLHWLLDRMIDEAKNKDSIKVVGEKIGLAPTSKSNDFYKIKGYDPRAGNDEFIRDYTQILGQFISRRLALLPSENEGIRLDFLEKFIEPDHDGFIPPPIPPGVTPLEMVNAIPTGISLSGLNSSNAPPIQTAPPAPKRKTRGKAITPTVGPVNTEHQLSAELLNRSFQGQLQGIEDKFMRLESIIDSLEQRVFQLEVKLRP